MPDTKRFDGIAIEKTDEEKLDMLIWILPQKQQSAALDRNRLDSLYYYLNLAQTINNSLRLEKYQLTIDCFYEKYYLLKGEFDKAKDKQIKIEQTIGRTSDPMERASSWLTIAKIIYNVDSVGITRIYCFEKAIENFKEANNLEKSLEYKRNIADEHMKLGKLDLAESELLNVLQELKISGLKKLHYVYNLLSITNTYKGNYNVALEYGLLAIENMKQTNDVGSSGRYYTRMAYLYKDIGQPNKSIEYFTLAMNFLPGTKRYYDYRDIGSMAGEMIKVNKAKDALERVMAFYKKYPPENPLCEASYYRTMGNCYKSLGNIPTSNKYLEKMIRISPLLDKDNEIRQEVEYDIANYCFENNRLDEAAKHLKISLEEAIIQNATKIIRDINLLFFKIDSSQGKYISAINHLNAYRTLNDSIFNEAKSRQIEEVQAKYEAEKKEQNILILQQENLVQQNNLKQAVITRNFVLASIVLLSLITALLYNRYIIKRNSNEKLSASQLEIEKQNSSLKHLVTEKEWLVKEIHHRVKNNLHTIIGLLDAQTSFLKSEEAIEAVSDSQHRVQAMSLIHQKLFQSEGLSTVEMSPYIYELVDYLEHSLRMPHHIRFNIDVDDCIFSLSHALPVGLILNEAITNALKYAFPNGKEGLIGIQLKKHPGDYYKLVIADNGIGLPGDFDERKNHSMGMNLMQGLSEDLHGQLLFKTDNGTILEISFLYEAA